MGRIVFAILGVVALVAIVLVIVNPFAESEEEKALTAVCNSKVEIQKQVDSLKSITPATFTTQEVQDSITAIGDELGVIRENIPTLADDVRADVQAANQKFRSSFLSITAQVAKTLSAEDAAAQLKQAFTELATAYGQAFASVKCPA